MQIEVTPEVLLSQLGIAKSEAAYKQIEKAMNNTTNFSKFAKHIISLNDELKHMNAYVALSNSQDVFKIKCDSNDAPEILDEFHQQVQHFSSKYNVNLQAVDGKSVYYIIGAA